MQAEHDRRETLTRWFPEQNEVDLPEITLPVLLEETWNSIKNELETNQSSQALIDLRKEYGDKLKAWWASKRAIFLEKVKDTGGEMNGKTVKLGDEEITLVQAGDYYREDEVVLNIYHKTPVSESEMSVRISEDTGVDTFLNPPKITSKVKDKPGGDWLTYWEVVFRGSAVSTITRTRVHDHPDYQLPYVKHTEIIDASIFGVDTQAR